MTIRRKRKTRRAIDRLARWKFSMTWPKTSAAQMALQVGLPFGIDLVSSVRRVKVSTVDK
jgi:hypothetical protein